MRRGQSSASQNAYQLNVKAKKELLEGLADIETPGNFAASGVCPLHHTGAFVIEVICFIFIICFFTILKFAFR
jgi:hypothetical protein